MLSKFKDAILSPKKAANKIAAKTDIGDGVKVLLVASLIILVVNAVLTTIANFVAGIVGLVFGNNTLLANAIGGLIGTILGVIILVLPALIFAIIISFIAIGIIWGICKLLGGKAPFGKYYGAMQYASGAVGILSTTVTGLLAIVTALFIGFSPAIGGLVAMVMMIPSMLVSLYGFYVTVIFTREVQKMSTIKALIAVLIPALIIIGLLVAMIALLVAIFGAAILGGMGAGPIPLS